jgi:hypothetical protein
MTTTWGRRPSKASRVRSSQRLAAAFGLADDIEIGFTLEQGQKSAADDRVVVDH